MRMNMEVYELLFTEKRFLQGLTIHCLGSSFHIVLGVVGGFWSGNLGVELGVSSGINHWQIRAPPAKLLEGLYLVFALVDTMDFIVWRRMCRC